jgi:effector-binding domain-containing protein
MIRIGDFSKLSRVSIKTLRYYDEMDLLKPAYVDDSSGYRFYEYHQLPRLYRILALKDLGFPLEEIGQLLTGGLHAGQVRGMLMLRQADIRQKVKDETERLGQVEVWLRHIEQEDSMSKYDVVVKEVKAVRVASIRGTVPTPPDQGRLWNELEGNLKAQHIRLGDEPCLTLYYDEEYKERDWDLEVCEPIPAETSVTGDVRVWVLPGVERMACTVHHGPFITISEAYNAIGKWIDASGYRIIGPCREVYLHTARDGSQSDPDTVTEIQFPVEKMPG